MRLEGKVAVVTGAARGIGEAISRAFGKEGARVLVTDIDEAGAQRLASAIGQEALGLDVREEKDWRVAIDAVLAAHGRLDVLVNNAGVTGFEAGMRPHDPENADLEDWRAVHRTNLDGVFLGCKHAIRAMRPAKAGSIINISSRSGVVGIPAAAAFEDA
jgi:NAD(P)-dependent dehydrogenase (short-subunit alcohol dehydrogenase family)